MFKHSLKAETIVPQQVKLHPYEVHSWIPSRNLVVQLGILSPILPKVILCPESVQFS